MLHNAAQQHLNEPGWIFESNIVSKEPTTAAKQCPNSTVAAENDRARGVAGMKSNSMFGEKKICKNAETIKMLKTAKKRCVCCAYMHLLHNRVEFAWLQFDSFPSRLLLFLDFHSLFAIFTSIGLWEGKERVTLLKFNAIFRVFNGKFRIFFSRQRWKIKYLHYTVIEKKTGEKLATKMDRCVWVWSANITHKSWICLTCICLTEGLHLFWTSVTTCCMEKDADELFLKSSHYHPWFTFDLFSLLFSCFCLIFSLSANSFRKSLFIQT